MNYNYYHNNESSDSSSSDEENQTLQQYKDFRTKIFTPDIEKRKLLISSADINQVSDDHNTNNYTIYFNHNNTNNNESGYGHFKNIIGFRLLEAGLVVSPHNINTKNNEIIFQINNIDTNLKATLTIGSYNNDELATELARALNVTAGGTHFSATFDSTNHKFNIQNTTFNFKFLWLESNNLSYRLFGFNKKDATSFTPALSPGLTSDNPSDHSHRFIDLVIPQIPYKACIHNSTGKNIINRIPLNEISGDMVHYTPLLSDYEAHFFPITLDSLNIQLHSEYDNILYDTQNYDNYFCFEITILKNLDQMN